MTFTESIRTVLSKYATFSGRAQRSEFWWWILFVFILQIVLQIIDNAVLGFDTVSGDSVGPLSGIATLALLIPNLAVGARRLHDTGRSGWWQLLVLIPLIGAIILLIWYASKGEEGTNKYGAPPRGVAA
jgi:uncharacterized membrane protein YhaH (DUF805 family)